MLPFGYNGNYTGGILVVLGILGFYFGSKIPNFSIIILSKILISQL